MRRKKRIKKEESLSNEGSKGFMASMKSTIGGFFYGEKVSKEDTKEAEEEQEPVSNDPVNSEKESEKPDQHVPREFLMQPTSQNENISSSSLTKKQPINLKDENETILEEIEPIEVKTEKEPAVVTMVTCQSETTKQEKENVSTSSKENSDEKTAE